MIQRDFGNTNNQVPPHKQTRLMFQCTALKRLEDFCASNAASFLCAKQNFRKNAFTHIFYQIMSLNFCVLFQQNENQFVRKESLAI